MSDVPSPDSTSTGASLPVVGQSATDDATVSETQREETSNNNTTTSNNSSNSAAPSLPPGRFRMPAHMTSTAASAMGTSSPPPPIPSGPKPQRQGPPEPPVLPANPNVTYAQSSPRDTPTSEMLQSSSPDQTNEAAAAVDVAAPDASASPSLPSSNPSLSPTSSLVVEAAPSPLPGISREPSLLSTTSDGAEAAADPDAAAAAAAEKQAKRDRIRTKVAFEIESTELSYVESLENLSKLYIVPLSASAAQDDDPILSSTELQHLFSNIGVIAGLNRKFLTDISARLQGWDNNNTMIGDIFLGFTPFFKMYTSYCGNHDNATDLLRKLEKENRRFRELIELTLAKPENKNLSLASYLIMPIQRIPRYVLLISELLRMTPETHPDFPGLSKGLDLVSQVAKHVNAEMHASENRSAILRIQSEFTHPVDFVSPSRKFVRQGTLVKKCRNSDKTYEFFLFNDMLVYASTSLLSSSGQRYKLHQQIPIERNFRISDVPSPSSPGGEEVHLFQIDNIKKSFIVCVPDLAVKTSWLQSFAQVLAERDARTKAKADATAGGAIQSGPKEVVAPVWKADQSQDSCPCCEKKFTFTRRRHHCRKCGGLCCNACSLKRMVIKSAGEARDPQRVCDRCVDEITAQHRKTAEMATELARQAMGVPSPAQPAATPVAESPAPTPVSPPSIAQQSVAAAAAAAAATLLKRGVSVSKLSSNAAALTSPPAFTTVDEAEDDANSDDDDDDDDEPISVAGSPVPPPTQTQPTQPTQAQPPIEPPTQPITPAVAPAPVVEPVVEPTPVSPSSLDESAPETVIGSVPNSSFGRGRNWMSAEPDEAPTPVATVPTPTPPPARALPPTPPISANSAPKMLVEVCRVLYDYTAAGADDLTLIAGELLRVDVKDVTGWWRGENTTGVRGTFPSNYVELLPERQEFAAPAERPGPPLPPMPAALLHSHSHTASASSRRAFGSAIDAAAVAAKTTLTSPANATLRRGAVASPPPAAEEAAHGPCIECDCTAFTANAFKPAICRECRHNKTSHA